MTEPGMDSAQARANPIATPHRRSAGVALETSHPVKGSVASVLASVAAPADRLGPGATDEHESSRMEKLERQLRDAQELIARLQQQQQPCQDASLVVDGATPRGDSSTEVQTSQVDDQEASRYGGVPPASGNSGSAASAVRLAPSPPPVAQKPKNLKFRKPSQASEDAISGSTPLSTPESAKQQPKRLLSGDQRVQSPVGARPPPPPPPRRGSVLTPMDDQTNCSSPGTVQLSCKASPSSLPTSQSRIPITVSLPSPMGNTTASPDLRSTPEDPAAASASTSRQGAPGPIMTSSARSADGGRHVASSPGVRAAAISDGRARSSSRSSNSSNERNPDRYSGAIELAELELLCEDAQQQQQQPGSQPAQHITHGTAASSASSSSPSPELQLCAATVEVGSQARATQPSANDLVCAVSTTGPHTHVNRLADSPCPIGSFKASDRPSEDAAARCLPPRESPPLLRQYATINSHHHEPGTGRQESAVARDSSGPSTHTTNDRTSGAGGSMEAALRLAAEDGQLACVKLLLAQGADCKNFSEDNSLAIHLAAGNGHTSCVEELISSGASSWTVDGQGLTALQLAAKNGHAACVQSMLRACGQSGEEVDRQRVLENALLLACLGNHQACIRALQKVVSVHNGSLQPSQQSSVGTTTELLSPRKSNSIVSPSSTDSALGGDEGSSGPSPAHDMAQEDKDETHAEVDVFLQHECLGAGRSYGMVDDARVRLGSVSISMTTTWSQLEMDVWKRLDTHLSAVCKSLPLGTLVENQQMRPILPPSVPRHDPVVKTATLKSITSWSSSITNTSASSYCTSNASTQQLPTTGQMKVSTVYASDIGLGVDSVKMYHSGDKKWWPDTLTPMTDEGINDAASTSPYQLFGDEASLSVTLKGIGDGKLDLLAYQTLIPINTLKSYLEKFRHYGKVLFSGPPACGKSEIATSLARCLLNSLKSDGVKVDMLGCALRGQQGEQERILSMLHTTGLFVEEDYNIGECSVQASSSSSPARHCILVVESSSAAAIQNGLGELLSCIHGDRTMWINGGALPSGLYRLVGALHLMVTLDTTGPIGLDPRSWHRFFHIRWRWDVEPLGGQLQRYLQRQQLTKRDGVDALRSESNESGQDCVVWINDTWQRINKLFSFLGYNQLVLGPNVFFSCPVQSGDVTAIASWLAELWNNQLAPCIEEVMSSQHNEGSGRHLQLTSVKLLLVTIRLALLPSCPLQGNDLAQWLESLHCGMDSEEINDMVQEIRDNVISTSSDAMSLDFEEELASPSISHSKRSPALPSPLKTSTDDNVLDYDDSVSEDLELAKIEAQKDPGTPSKDSRPETPSFFKRFQTLRNSARLSKRVSVAPDSTTQRPVKGKTEEKEFFAMISKIQGDRIDDQRVTAPACMFMTKPRQETRSANSTPSKVATSTPSKLAAGKSDKKAAKKSRKSSHDNILTQGRQNKSNKHNDYDNIFDHDIRQEPASRSASADFLNTVDSEDSVFCSSPSESPDMSALHLPPGGVAGRGPAAGAGRGGGSLRTSYTRRRSMSELMKLGGGKADLEQESRQRHKSLSKLKSTQSVGRGGTEVRHHRSASNVFSLSTVTSSSSSAPLGDTTPLRQMHPPSPRKIASQPVILPLERPPSQVTYM